MPENLTFTTKFVSNNGSIRQSHSKKAGGLTKLDHYIQPSMNDPGLESINTVDQQHKVVMDMTKARAS